MWLLKYPDQKVAVAGEGEVTVIGGEEEFNTYASAAAYLENLRKRWPGLQAEIGPLLLKNRRTRP